MISVENDIGKLWIDNGILYSTFKSPTDMTVNKAIKFIELRHHISNNQSQYWCMDARKLRSTTRDAIDYIDNNGQELVYACATLVNTYLTKFLIDLFNKLKKPKVPLKTFTSQESAINWLNEIRAQNNMIKSNSDV